jgi:formylglycine-generating enzyme required for sulfatase activity
MREMAPETTTRRTNPWPLAGILLLVVLLSAFLVLQWRRRDAERVRIKEPVPAPAPHASAEPEVPPPPPRAAEPAPAPRPNPTGEYASKLEAARKAADEGRWDEAEKLAGEARALAPEGEGLRELADRISRGRKAESERAAEERRRREKTLAEIRERVEKLRRDDLWEAALEALEKARTEHPGLAADEEFRRLTDQIAALRREAEQQYERSMAEARRHLEAGAFPAAVAAAERAAAFYPERRGLVNEFQERVRTLSARKNMVRIPSTVCWVGGDSDEHPDEKPLRSVRLPPFLIDRYEVTNEEYYAFMLATRRPPPARSPYWPGGKPLKGRERHPVVYVTYEDAEAYARWAGKRLPTAEEWEVAARGPDRREYPWGNLFAEKENVFHANSLEYWQLHKHLAPGTAPVDATDLPNDPSPFGVYGMAGNVWEWTSTAVRCKAGDREEEFRILKGGSFMTDRRALRCANVYPEDPRLGHPDVGFRCVADIP